MADIGECPQESQWVKDQLALLGLAWPDLWEAIQAGEGQRQTSTKYEPPPGAGLKDWIARVGALRKTLADQDWAPSNDDHISLSLHPAHTIAIGVLLGDEKTGEEPPTAKGPRSRYPKGPKILEVTSHNTGVQLAIGEDEDPEPVQHDGEDTGEDEGAPQQDVWFLVTRRLVHPNPPDPEFPVLVFSELSLPGRSTDEDTPAYIDTWIKRIPLPPSPFRILNPDTPAFGDEQLDELPKDL